jgi:hypothetical protein
MPPIVDPGIGVEVAPFQYKPPYYHCSGGSDGPDRFEASLRVFRTSGNYDFRVCQVHVLGPFKNKAKVEIEHMTCPYTAWVTITLGVTQYDYTPVKVIISTTHGALHAVIAPPAQRVSDEERRQADLEARFERVSRCYAKSKRWDIRWRVNPSPYVNVVRTRQIWTVVGVAADEARRVDVVNEAGGPLATVDTGLGRAFRLSLVEPSGALSVIQDVADESERLESADLHAVQILAGVERELDFETPVLGVDAVRMSRVRKLVVHERDCLTLFDVTERGEVMQMRTLETGGAEWVGRRGGILYARLRDGRLLSFNMEGIVGWREERREEERSYGGCGCSDAAKEDAAVERPLIGLPMDERQFEHLVYKRDMRTGYSGESVRIRRSRNGFWIEEADGVLITSAVDRKVRGGAEVRLASATASVIRLRSGMMLATGEHQNKLELLHALSRQEL